MDNLGPSGLLALFGLVTFGSLIPIVPTGSILSAAAALAHSDNPAEIGIVVVLAAAGAYIGDLGSFLVLRGAGQEIAKIPILGRLVAKATAKNGDQPSKVDQLVDSVRKNSTKTLIVGRLLPGGRLPSLTASALVKLPTHQFLVSNVPAVLIWAVVYGVLGYLGSAVIPNPTVAVIVVVVLGLVLSKVIGWVHTRMTARKAPTSA